MSTAIYALPTTYKFRDTDMIFSSSDDNMTNEYILRVRDLPDNDKPREKLLNGDAKQMTVAELVAVLWGVGTKKEDVLAMAQRATHEYGEKALAVTDNPAKLAESADIPITKACQIVAGFELGRRFYSNKNGQPIFIRNAAQAYAHLKGMASGKKEQLRGLYLNSRYQVVHDEVISIGTLTSNIVHPREVFQPAIEHGAIAVIIAHNHPSDSTMPTDDDLTITSQLVTAGKILGIDLLDHLIITNDTFLSILNGDNHHA
jgi:DNA repair protein RadC